MFLSVFKISRIFKSYFFLSFLLLAGFLFFSKLQPFIPLNVLMAFGSNLSKPWTFITYFLMHTGLFHLLVNTLSVFAFSFILEKKLSTVEILKIFFIGVIGSGLVFSLIHPEITLLGASAGVASLMASSLILKPKESVFAIVLIFLLLQFVFFPIINFALNYKAEALVFENKKLSEDLNKALTAKDFQMVNNISKQLSEKKREIEDFYQSKEFAIQTKTNFFVHAIGAFFGLFYLVLFHKPKLDSVFSSIRRNKK